MLSHKERSKHGQLICMISSNILRVAGIILKKNQFIQTLNNQERTKGTHCAHCDLLALIMRCISQRDALFQESFNLYICVPIDVRHANLFSITAQPTLIWIASLRTSEHLSDNEYA